MPQSLFTPLTAMLSNGLREIANTTGHEQVQKINQFFPGLAQELQRMPRRLRSAKLQIKETKSSFSAFIQLHQEDLMDLISIPLAYADPREIVFRHETDPLKALCSDVYQLLDGLLDHLRNQYPEQFGYDIPIPKGHLAILRHEIERDLPATLSSLRLMGADDGLLAIATEPFSDFATQKTTRAVTCSHVMYLKTLHEGLVNIYQIPQLWRTPNQGIRHRLHTLNFNSQRYETYGFTYMKQRLAELPSSDKKILELERFKNLLEQVPVDKNIALNPNRHKLKTTLRNWMTSQIQYEEKQREMGSGAGNGKDSAPATGGEKPDDDGEPGPTKDNWQLKFSDYTNVLIGLMSVLKENVVFKNVLNADWIRFIHIAFRTSNGQRIGMESIKKQFMKTEPQVLDKIAELLVNLLVFVMNRRKEMGCRKEIFIPPSLFSKRK